MSFYFFDANCDSYQTLPLNTVIYDKTSLPKTCPFGLHNHEALEIIVLLDGRLQVSVGEQEYVLNPGDTVLVNPFTLHAGKWLSSGAYDRYLCLTTTLSNLITYNNSPLLECCEALGTGKFCFDEFYPAGESHIAKILCRIHDIYTHKSNANECYTLMQLFELIGLLFEKHYHPNVLPQSSRKNVEFSRDVSLYINSHYNQDITTSDAAAALYMELSQFCHMFKQNFGVPFRSRLCHYRCIRASELYSNTDWNIADIAAAVGFSDYCYFSRSFKKYIGVTPAIYFGKWRNK